MFMAGFFSPRLGFISMPGSFLILSLPGIYPTLLVSVLGSPSAHHPPQWPVIFYFVEHSRRSHPTNVWDYFVGLI
jgi:hypothetical protein